MSSGNQVLLGQYGATNRTCSSSSLILHSVCASRLTAGNAYLCRVRHAYLEGTHICVGPGASCVPVHPYQALPRVGSRTTGRGWFLEMQTGLPDSEPPPNQLNRLGMESLLPWKCHWRQLIGRPIPWMWMARRDLNSSL